MYYTSLAIGGGIRGGGAPPVLDLELGGRPELTMIIKFTLGLEFVRWILLPYLLQVSALQSELVSK